MTPIIEVENLCKTFGSFEAVSNLSFQVNKADVYGFLGQNGAGKSTTLRMLLGLIFPNEGSINILGNTLTKNKNEVLQKIGAIIEKPDVYKYLTAYQNLQLFAKLSQTAISKRQLDNTLSTVGLNARANDKVKTFSQGMKQRLGIAIALVHNPEIIILDEPTNGLDPQGIADVRNLILHLSLNESKTVIVSSHLLHEIEQIASRVLIIDKGKKIAEGNAQQLFREAEVLVEIKAENLSIINPESFTSVAQTVEFNQKWVIKIQQQLIPQLLQQLVQQSVLITSVQQRNSLEDYFLKVTTINQNVAAFSN